MEDIHFQDFPKCYIKNMYRVFTLLLLTTVLIHADDIKLRDGTVYKDAKVVSHNATAITILYANGGATIPLAKLPDDLQKKYGYDADAAANFVGPSPVSNGASGKAAEWSKYRQALDKYVQVEGKLVSREAANVATLNVKLNHVAEVKNVAGENLGRGSYVDVYDANATTVADPSTLKPTGSPVFLKDYVLNSDKITKVEAVKTGATEAGEVYYVVVIPFSFDFWKKSGMPQ